MRVGPASDCHVQCRLILVLLVTETEGRVVQYIDLVYALFNCLTPTVCRCRTMREMAAYHTDSYQSPAPVVYGSLPHDPNAWDADKISSCIADTYGYDFNPYTYNCTDTFVTATLMNATYTSTASPNDLTSSAVYPTIINITSPILDSAESDQYHCSVGYNMRFLDSIKPAVTGTNYSHFIHEVQQFACTARQGGFYLSFRGATSEYIAHNTSVLNLQLILQSMPAVGLIQLTYAYRDLSYPNATLNPAIAICDPYYLLLINITFLSNLGQVPLLTPQFVGFAVHDNLEVTRLQEGALPGLIECSGHGLCDPWSGRCQCDKGYGSSDGFGGAGYRNDCGHNLIY